MCRRVCVLVFLVSACAGAQVVVDLLPDMVVDTAFLEDHEIRTDIKPNKTHLIFSNAMANVGDGPLYVFGVNPKDKGADDETQKVKQRIFRSDGSHYNRVAGHFVYHSQHNHTHFEDWAIYRLREILPNDGVGDIIATSKKTSFCLLDSFEYDLSLPNAPDNPEFISCSTDVQGISVGYEDLYDKSIPGQWIDITNVPNGDYWLESEVDPENNVLEKDDANNVGRIKVTVDKDTPPDPDPDPGPNPSGLLAAILALLQSLLDFLRGGT
ncbi:MAG: hypothetical protein HUU46_00930 [Candidatus Hydrogenedentes bacterium]|nr:hypothetical protein [Candidatus Hydrogenedentota bacterium]